MAKAIKATRKKVNMIEAGNVYQLMQHVYGKEYQPEYFNALSIYTTRRAAQYMCDWLNNDRSEEHQKMFEYFVSEKKMYKELKRSKKTVGL